MLSFIKGLFSTKETAKTIVEGVRDGADALFYTDEEKAADNKEMVGLRNETQKLWLEALEVDADSSSIRSVTRRWISLLVIGHYFIWIDVSLIAFGMGNEDLAKYAWDIVVEVYWLVFAVASFYFGPGMVERIVASRRKAKK